jgi:hypothetical protein
MYLEERKLHWEVRMTYILGKIELAKVTYILGRRESCIVLYCPWDRDKGCIGKRELH